MEPFSAGLPDPDRLYELFNHFLISWANLEARFMGPPLEDWPALPLEQGIFFHGPFEGLLVARSTESLEGILQEVSTGKRDTAPPPSKRLFVEMTVLYWHNLLMQTWRLDTRNLEPAVLKATLPRQWPDRKPDSGCVLMVREIPLEIRLWAYLSPSEIQSWGSRR